MYSYYVAIIIMYVIIIMCVNEIIIMWILILKNNVCEK